MHVKAMRTLGVGFTALLLLGACSEPEPGSRGDLEAQIESIEVPSGMTELGQKYVEECATSCPSLVAWYGSNQPVDVMRAGLFEAITEAGWDVKEANASTELFAARKEDHILFVTTVEQMLADSATAPEGTVAELSVNVLDAPPDL